MTNPTTQPQEVKQKRKNKINPFNRPGPRSDIDSLYATVEKFEAKISKYFDGGAYKRKVVTQLGVEVEIPTPTISDLVLFLGFNDRKRFFAYETHPVFGDSIKKARTMIEREYEMLLRTNCGGGPIFALKNFGWIDRQEHEHMGEVNFNFNLNGIVSNSERQYASRN